MSEAVSKELIREKFEKFWNTELPVCDTTMTPRLPRTRDCDCPTYSGNLGPCVQLGELGPTGKCPYCDHLPKCHLREVFKAGWQAASLTSGQDVAYWKCRAETAELKVLTFHEEIAKCTVTEKQKEAIARRATRMIHYRDLQESELNNRTKVHVLAIINEELNK